MSILERSHDSDVCVLSEQITALWTQTILLVSASYGKNTLCSQTLLDWTEATLLPHLLRAEPDWSETVGRVCEVESYWLIQSSEDITNNHTKRKFDAMASSFIATPLELNLVDSGFRDLI